MTADSYFDLGAVTRDVTTSSESAQLWFDRGLAWCFGFNFEEAVRCFQRAVVEDPECAIAYWGIAYASGPNYNKAWRLFDTADYEAMTDRSLRALDDARSHLENATAGERALIEALRPRYRSGLGPDERAPLNLAYADAMRTVHEAFPDDLDIAALFVEAVMCVSPRRLWHVSTGEPTGQSTVEARNILERAMDTEAGRAHPAINHLYIHLMEMSQTPEIATRASSRLRGCMPDAGHMAHMSTHIDIANGDYRRSVDSGTDAIAANDRYLATVDDWSFYHVYRAHDTYVKVYAAMMLGSFDEAWGASQKLLDCLPEEMLRVTSPPMADWVESHVATYAHVLIRFGRWDQIIDLSLPEDTELYCVTTAMILYAKGVAYSATGRVTEAEQTREKFRAALSVIPNSRMTLPNREIDILQVADAMLDGELEYRKGNHDVAYAHLREAIEREDALLYSDPRPWLQPVRHAYGALLLEQGHLEQAAAVYRADLGLDGSLPRTRVHPNNVWSLHGLHEALTRMGRTEEASMIALQRNLAVAAADSTIEASCACRMNTAAAERESDQPAIDSCCSH
ncbi:tetratricopeptide repeat protein [Rhodococcus sp. MEB064]|uniref:tetratricopeptide repeat protein n=1 Tax=Rhodococcus sp. MEB064 TaxID=1587522 RepID=UPI0005AC24AC|nr:hypothetical protein [Rhodococcus sp. MEB064]KIQ08030.1 hypothetical protein RU01_21800 [Rhodococcus sp. MEB064]